MMEYEQAIREEILVGDEIIEQGQNGAGRYTKLESGKLIMYCIGNICSYESVAPAQISGSRLKMGKWK